MSEDTRNLTDELKGKSESEIICTLDNNGVQLEIAVENVERDFNMGSIIRTANAFGVRRVHIIGRRQWNKRGAMATDKYLHVHYYNSVHTFMEYIDSNNLQLIAVDNVEGAVKIDTAEISQNSVLIFGSESNGISEQLLGVSSQVVAIQQKGSTRSLNVGAAAAIAMYEWSRRHSY